MDSHADRLPTDHHHRLRLPRTAVIVVALITYLGVSAILEGTTGINVPFVSWRF